MKRKTVSAVQKCVLVRDYAKLPKSNETLRFPFLFLPAYGYLKQYAVETEEGVVVRLFPLTEEMENVEWLPGAIVLLTQEELKEPDINSPIPNAQQNYSKTSAEFYYNSKKI